MAEEQRQLMLGNLLPYKDMERLVFAFEGVLKEHGLQVASGSDLERTCLAVVDFLIKQQQPALLHPIEDIRRYFADVLGLWVFMNKLVRLREHVDFPQLIPHLGLLNEGGVPQNVRSPVSDQVSDKLFELLIALICMEKGQDVRLDDPCSSKGDNPDVMASILGRRWGFACKTMYSSSPKTMFDRICEGVDQIEKSAAEIGCVVVNFRNLIDHDRAWPILNEDEARRGEIPIFRCWPNPESVTQELAQLVLRKQRELEAAVGKEEIRKTFEGKKSVSAILAYLQTAAVIATPTGPVPGSVGALFRVKFGDVRKHLPVFHLLNSAMHRML